MPLSLAVVAVLEITSLYLPSLHSYSIYALGTPLRIANHGQVAVVIKCCK